ncbi:MAG: hypothetical protein U0R50_13010 [Gaiellales bacterium]
MVLTLIAFGLVYVVVVAIAESRPRPADPRDELAARRARRRA